MHAKTALELYRDFKGEIRKETICDNARGSELLFGTRVGVLKD